MAVYQLNLWECSSLCGTYIYIMYLSWCIQANASTRGGVNDIKSCLMFWTLPFVFQMALPRRIFVSTPHLKKEANSFSDLCFSGSKNKTESSIYFIVEPRNCRICSLLLSLLNLQHLSGLSSFLLLTSDRHKKKLRYSLLYENLAK